MILLTTATPFDSISDGTFTNGRTFVQTAAQAQEKANLDFFDAGEMSRGVEIEVAIATE
jgi:hypothetical protein